MMTSPFLRAASIVGLLVCGCASTEAGTSEDDLTAKGPTLLPNARLAPQTLADTTTVEKDRLLIARSEENVAWVERSVKKGRVIAGNFPSTEEAAQKNPHGFIRRVVSIDDSGDPIVIRTERAGTKDLIDGGKMRIGGDAPPLFKDAPTKKSKKSTLKTQSSHTVKENQGVKHGIDKDGAQKAAATEDSKNPTPKEGQEGPVNWHFNVTPSLNVETDISGDAGVDVDWFDIDVNGWVEAYFGASLTMGFNFGVDGAFHKEWSPTLPTPPKFRFSLAEIELKPSLTCSLDASGAASLVGEIVLGAEATGTVEVKNTAIDAGFGKKLTAEIRKPQLSGEAQVSVNCVATVSVTVWTLGADIVGVGVGGDFSVGTLGVARACASTALENKVQSAVYGKLSGKAEIKFKVKAIGKELFDQTLISWGELAEAPALGENLPSDAKYVVGDENTCRGCKVDESKEGKTIYCNQEAPLTQPTP